MSRARLEELLTRHDAESDAALPRYFSQLE